MLGTSAEGSASHDLDIGRPQIYAHYVRLRSGIRHRLDRASTSSISREVKKRNLTYLSYQSLRNLERCIRTIRREGVPGIFIEAGVALGGSAIVIAKLMPQDREFHGYDVFGMIPPPGDKDGAKSHERYRTIASGESSGIGGDTYYGYQDNLYDEVVATLAAYRVPVDGSRVSLHRGLFADTLHLDGKTVAFAHLDCDWYDPVSLCLERIYPVLAPGGFVVSDDYHNYEGATRAVDEFVAAHSDIEVIRSRRRPSRSTNLVLRRRTF